MRTTTGREVPGRGGALLEVPPALSLGTPVFSLPMLGDVRVSWVACGRASPAPRSLPVPRPDSKPGQGGPRCACAIGVSEETAHRPAPGDPAAVSVPAVPLRPGDGSRHNRPLVSTSLMSSTHFRGRADPSPRKGFQERGSVFRLLLPRSRPLIAEGSTLARAGTCTASSARDSALSPEGAGSAGHRKFSAQT